MKTLMLLCFLLGCASGHSDTKPHSDPILQMGLKAAGWTMADFSIRSDRIDDVDRLAVTRQLLDRPADAMQVTRAVRGETVVDLLHSAGALLDVRVRRDQMLASGEVPDDIPDGLRDLVSAWMLCEERIDSIFVAFAPEEYSRLGDLLALVDPGQTLSECEMDVLIALGRRVDRGRLLGAAIDLMAAIDGFVDQRPALTPMRLETPRGSIVVGGYGSDCYDEPAALLIDPGGDDRYESPASVRIDFAGRDTYAVATDNQTAGISVLVDVMGNDRYLFEGSGPGCGIAGIGVLDDREGNDVYRAGVGGQGFGLYGVGVLRDGAGHDRYGGALMVQGAAGPGGIGMLVDFSGNDVYEAGGVHRDFREDGRFFQSMAQGFGLGIRPLTSGGAGVLLDKGGDDQYRIDYFGQGAAFWGGSGLLLDLGGQDHYEARRYAQGAGVHLSAGLLLDASGDDTYTLWGVGQGCGHDLAVGILVDRAGSDRYRAVWLSQGAGNANGIGWLDDGAGDDTYFTERSDSQGYGAMARKYDSLGILIDRAGRDSLSGSGTEGALWIGGHSGVGIDWPLRAVGGTP